MCELCQEKAKYWILENTKGLCQKHYDLYKLISADTKDIEKIKEIIKNHKSVKGKRKKKDFSGLQVINNFSGRTTKF